MSVFNDDYDLPEAQLVSYITEFFHTLDQDYFRALIRCCRENLVEYSPDGFKDGVDKGESFIVFSSGAFDPEVRMTTILTPSQVHGILLALNAAKYQSSPRWYHVENSISNSLLFNAQYGEVFKLPLECIETLKRSFEWIPESRDIEYPRPARIF
jgi:hypothetical protein